MIKAIIFDFNRTLFDPLRNVPFTGALELILNLKKIFRLGLVSTGGESRVAKISESGLREHFDYIRVVEQKNEQVFLDFLKRFNFEPQELAVVGDYLGDEIACGNKIGAVTIWYKEWAALTMKVENEGHKPQFIAESYKDIQKILSVK